MASTLTLCWWAFAFEAIDAFDSFVHSSSWPSPGCKGVKTCLVTGWVTHQLVVVRYIVVVAVAFADLDTSFVVEIDPAVAT